MVSSVPSTRALFKWPVLFVNGICVGTLVPVLPTQREETVGLRAWLSVVQRRPWVPAVPERGSTAPESSILGQSPHLEVGEMLLHEAVDLAHRQAASLAALQGHGDQTAGARDGAKNRPQVTAQGPDCQELCAAPYAQS